MLQDDFGLRPVILWQDLKFSDKAKLCGYGSLFIILMNTVQIIGSLNHLGEAFQFFGGLEQQFPMEGFRRSDPEILVGFGCLLAWVTIIRYMGYSKQYAVLYKTLQIAMPNVIITLICILPILLGYTFLGMSWFYKSGRFSSTANSFSHSKP